MPARNAQVEAMARSIAKMENTTSYTSFLNGKNNPGALMYAGQAGASPYPVTGKDGKPLGTFAAFGTEQQGWDALYRQIELNAAKGLTVQEFFAGKPGVYGGYAPAGHGGNQPNIYATNVSRDLGISPATLVSSYLNGTPMPGAPSTSNTAPAVSDPGIPEPSQGSFWSDLFGGGDTDTVAAVDQSTGDEQAGISTTMILAVGGAVLFALAMSAGRR